MLAAARDVLDRDPRLAFALVFGSRATGAAHAASDLDVAVGLRPAASLSAADIGGLVAALESATRCDVDLVIVSEANIPLRHAIFRDGVSLFVHDRDEFVAQKAQAIVDWLDFQPTYEILVAGALRAAARG